MDLRQIAKEADDRLAVALSAGDIDAALDLYTEDCRMMPPGSPMTVGRQQVRQLVQGLVGKSLTIRYEQVRVERVGDGTIMSLGRGIGSLEGASIRSKHILLLRRDPDGVWRIAVDIYNFDEPGLG
jgi:uncharacterized protein (TIGR02246 family)